METIMEARRLLNSIEVCDDAFLEGTRNDDVVNWALARMIVAKMSGEELAKQKLQDDFLMMLSGLDKRQRDDLAEWEDDPVDKVLTCYRHYWELDVKDIEDKLIDQGGYNMYVSV